MACCGKRSVRYVPNSSPNPSRRRNSISSGYTYSSNPINAQPAQVYTQNHTHTFEEREITLSGRTYIVKTCTDPSCSYKQVVQKN